MQIKLIATVHGPMLCVVVLRIAVVLLFQAAACEGLCLYPSSWKSSSWWTAYSYRYPFQINHTHIKTFTRARETNSHQSQSDGQTFIDIKSVCYEDRKVGPFKRYYVRRRDNDDEDDGECVQVYERDNLMVQSIIPPAAVIRNKDMLVDSCMHRDADYQLPVSIFVKRPWNFTATCPFPRGRYHVTITSYLSDYRSCHISRFSYSRISVDTNFMIIRSCLFRSDIESPYNNVVLSCVGNVPASAIGSSQAKGEVSVLAYQKGPFFDTMPFFYVVRYVTYGNGTIHMSLQGNKDGKLQPDKDKGVDSSGNYGNIFTRELLLTADQCNDAYEQCQNGATCENTTSELKPYRCVCAPGYTGTHCESGPAAAVFGQDPGAIEPDGRTTEQLQSGGSSSTGLVVGLVVGALFVAAVIAFVVYRVRKSQPDGIQAEQMRAIDKVRS